MAFRKLDLVQRHENFDSCVLSWQDPVLHTEKTVNGAALRVDTAVLMKDCSEISKEQLDPKLITLESMIEAGVTLDPSAVMHLMNATDVSEIQERSSQLSENLYGYLVEQKLIEPDEN